MGNAETRGSAYGYRIIKIFPNSPADKAGLKEFVDFIIDISCPNDQVPITENYNSFYAMIARNENCEVTLKVFNILHRKARILTIIPNKDWEGADSLLGAIIRYEEFGNAHERVLKVGKVHLNSPAAIAGLIPETDYIIGSPQFVYYGVHSMSEHIHQLEKSNAIRAIDISVFNSHTQTIRSLLLTPNKNWGGEGYIGCEFELGILNQLPLLDESREISRVNSSDHIEILDKIPIQRAVSQEIIPREIPKVEPVDSKKPNLVDDSTLEIIPEFNLEKSNGSDLNIKESLTTREISASKLMVSFDLDLSQEAIDRRTPRENKNISGKLKGSLKSKSMLKSNAHPPRQKFEDLLEQENETPQKIIPLIRDKTEISAEKRDSPSFSYSIAFKKDKFGFRPGKHRSPTQEEEVEINFQGIERVHHIEDPPAKLPKIVESANSELTANSTVQERSFNDYSHEKSNSEIRIDAYEKPKCRAVIQYTFYSKKLGGEYVIKSTDLFNLEDLKQSL